MEDRANDGHGHSDGALLGDDAECTSARVISHDEDGCFKKLIKTISNRNKIASVDSTDIAEMNSEERKAQKEEDRIEFFEKLGNYKFYLASNFYEDNIGQVEINTDEDTIISTSFQIPAFVQCLTGVTRDRIPYKLNKVSQQEKLESFAAQIPPCITEMVWQ